MRNQFLKNYSFLTAVILGSASFCGAQTVNWGNTPGDQNYDSQGQLLTAEDFKFELGVFKDGFQPLEANIQQWLENWTPFDSAAYNESAGFFSSTWKASDAASDTAGSQAYVMIHRKIDATVSAEIYLASSATWKLPPYNGGPNAALPVEWRLSNATTIISGATLQLAAATVELQRYDAKVRKPSPVVAIVSSMAGVFFLTHKRRKLR